MTMNITPLTTYWNADDAHLVITFLDELREVLWTTYGEEISEMRQAASENNRGDGGSFDPEGEEITF